MLHQKTSIKAGMLLLGALILCSIANGQIFKPDLIAPAAKSSKTSKISVTWAIGKIAVVPVRNNNRLAVDTPFALLDVPAPTEELVALTIYPNPTKEWITLPFSFDEPTTIDLTISDLNGKNVRYLRTKVQQQSLDLNISNLAAGIYWITILDTNKTILHHSKISKI